MRHVIRSAAYLQARVEVDKDGNGATIYAYAYDINRGRQHGQYLHNMLCIFLNHSVCDTTTPMGKWWSMDLEVYSLGVSVTEDSCIYYECHYPPCTKMEKELREFSICGRCQQVRYCGTFCQERDWPMHKRFCREKKPPAFRDYSPDR
ncbi:hypothetical protein C0Q70_17554 [Pomacea canaliculata]|uniref:MYND-type domain-containing protein n=1 Tax=Pomacea canaliculata TaxID=400727 RepID=A0A2T7NKQ5_POMCA|nr:hypothetical protein C0Q70_17554 [Pomacea canaliculata]